MSGGPRDCRRCGSSLERPGDYCLVCRTPNADGAVVDAGRDRATVTVLEGEAVVGETTITTTPETGERETAELRNFVGRVVDELRRKRPDDVYLAGDRGVLRAVRARLHFDCYRIDGDDPVGAALARRGERDLEVIDAPPAEKLGGSHSTLIGGRAGRRIVEAVASHPHVKSIIPGPIESGGTGSSAGVRGKATRADGNGNLRLLIHDGSTVQENRIVTTAMNRDLGERVRDDLNELLDEAGLS